MAIKKPKVMDGRGNKNPKTDHLKGYKWKKGQSGNPGGRPKKGICLTTILKDVLRTIHTGDKQKRTFAELIAIATATQAIKGNPQALKIAWERMEGRLAQPIEGSSPDKPPIRITILPADDVAAEEARLLEGLPAVAKTVADNDDEGDDDPL